MKLFGKELSIEQTIGFIKCNYDEIKKQCDDCNKCLVLSASLDLANELEKYKSKYDWHRMDEIPEENRALQIKICKTCSDEPCIEIHDSIYQNECFVSNGHEVIAWRYHELS